MKTTVSEVTEITSFWFLEIIENDSSPGEKNDYAYIISQRENISRDKLLYALTLAQDAVRSISTSPEFLDTLGFIYYKLGQYYKAIYYFELS